MTATTQTGSVLRRCIYCKAEGVAMAGEGPRKRCVDERACAARVSVGDPSLRPTNGHLNGNGRPAIATSAAPHNPNGTNAEALIELMQARAQIEELAGPVDVGESLCLPIESLLMRAVAFGKPNCGKTNASAVMIENCMTNNVPVVAIDILGRLWGTRAAGDKPGVPIPIIGGDHGDLPLQSDAGVELAQRFGSGKSMILDCSLLTREAQQWFAAEFFGELMRVLRIPAVVVVEEAETVVPAFSRSKSQFASQGAVSLWARQCRNYGSGWFFSTQRPQLLHPDVIDASSAFLAMQTTGDNASKAILKEATSRFGKSIAQAILNELGQLAQGETWLLPDPSWLGGSRSAPMKFKIRKRWTYDSTAVPVIGKPMAPAPKLVAVNAK